MSEVNDTRGNGFTNTMEGKCCVPLVQLGMWDKRTINHRLVVTKHVSLASDWNA